MKTNRILAKGELTFAVLRALSRASLGLENLVDRILTPGLGPKGQLTRNQFITSKKRSWEREKENAHKNLLLREKVKISALINRLQKMGLVKKESQEGRRAAWSITNKGLVKALELEEKLMRLLNREELPKNNYSALKSPHKIIVIFDIIETQKRKRDWLRQVLRRLNFRLLQKSVWIGDSQVPPELIQDLKRLNILRDVKIFSVFEEGNIIDD